MIVEQLDESLIGTGHILRSIGQPTLDDPYWIGFHGTSSVNASEIELEGISGSRKPIKRTDLNFIIALADEMETRFRELQKEKSFCGWRLQLVNYATSNVVNFFPLSELALGHTDSKGGQILQHALKPLINFILKHPGFAGDSRVARLRGLLNDFSIYDQGFPIVYAVCLEKIRPLGYQVVQMAIQTNRVVRPCHFVAKLEARGFDRHAQITAQEVQLRAAADNFALNQRSKHFVGIMHRDELKSIPWDLKEEIAKRAYELWESSERVHGNDLAHWFQAENDIGKNWTQAIPGTSAGLRSRHLS